MIMKGRPFRAGCRSFFGGLLFLALALPAPGCFLDLDPALEGFPCNPDGTCENDLFCIDGICVEDPCLEMECGDGEVCVFGSCVPQSCDDRVCPEGLVCIDGDCVSPSCANVTCDEGHLCADGRCYPTECAGIDCGAGVCVDGKCVPRSCVGVSCPEGQACAQGECYPVDCAVECAPGEVCVGGECVEASCAGVFCPEGEACGRGLCWPILCEDHNCGPGEVCVDGACTPRSCAGVTCPEGMECAAGECRPATCSVRRCGPREVCQEELDECVPDVCYGRVCPEGESCVAGGQCVPIDCDDQECPDGQVCDVGGDRCVDVSCYGLTCEEESECVRGACYPEDCEEKECGPEEVCVDGECIEATCVGVECPAGQSCEGGICVASEGCNLPWGGTIEHEEVVTAYEQEEVLCGEVCESEVRECFFGELSGSYTHETCTVLCASCAAVPREWGEHECGAELVEMEHGESLTVSNEVGGRTGSATFSCNDGTWEPEDGGSCDADACDLPWGGTIEHEEVVTAYEQEELLCGEICESEVRDCVFGELLGSFAHESCTPGTIYTVPAAPGTTGDSLCGSGTVNLIATQPTGSDTNRWYTASSGGSPVHTGTSYSPSLSATTTYYVSSYHTTTGCESTTRTVVTGTINTVPGTVTVSGGGTQCGGSLTLTVSGGTGGTIYWQNTTSNGTSTATATTSRSVSASGTYYFRARSAEGCWGTQGSATVTINSLPGTVTVSGGGTHCGSATLTASGGSGGTIYWQNTTINGTSTATATTSRSVSASGNYYFRARSAEGCWGTQGSASVTVHSASTAPTSLSASANPVCSGSSTTLTASGGTHGGDANYQFGAGSTCGSNILVTQASASCDVSPSGNTTYWVRRVGGTCNVTTTCVTRTLTVDSPNTAPTGVSATVDPVCPGCSTTLTATGGTLDGGGASYQWFTGSCGGTLISSCTGVSCTVSPPSATTYYVRRVGGTCNLTTACASRSITMQQTCDLPWGGTINEDQSVTAYQTSSASHCSESCVGEIRTCQSGGYLSGSYIYQSCNEITCSLGYNCELGGCQPAGISNCGDVIIDGETYGTVVVGNLCWINRNVNSQNHAAGSSYCYDNDPDNCGFHGRLYDWDAANEVCPSGWRLATRGDYYVTAYHIIDRTSATIDTVGLWMYSCRRGPDNDKCARHASPLGGCLNNDIGDDMFCDYPVLEYMAWDYYPDRVHYNAYGLRITASGTRFSGYHGLYQQGRYWTSTMLGIYPEEIRFSGAGAMGHVQTLESIGNSVRCAKTM